MRDVQELQSSATVKLQSYPLLQNLGSTTYNFYTLVKGRSDAVTTIRRGGLYVDPTGYTGKYYMATKSAFDGLFTTLGGGKVHIFGDSSPDYYANSLSPSWGCYGLRTGPNFPTSSLNNLASELRAKALKSEWNLGQSVAELPETIGFIIDSMKLIASLLTAIRSGNARSYGRLLRDVLSGKTVKSRKFSKFRQQLVDNGVLSNRAYTFAADGRFLEAYPVTGFDVSKYHLTRGSLVKGTLKAGATGWLVYQFAIMPLMNDIYQACKFMSEGLQTPGAFHARATATVPELGPPPPFWKQNKGASDGKWSERRDLFGEIFFSPANPTAYKLDQLGITNPLSIAWQLLPLSFVVDWFLPIGNFLSALSAPMGLSYHKGYRTSFQQWSLAVEYLPPNTYARVSGTSPKTSAMSRAFTRDLYLTFPVPAPYFRGFGNLSKGKVTSLTALTLQKFF